MNVQYSARVLKRIKERGLTKRAVAVALNNPDSIQPSFRGRQVASKKIGKKVIEVVYVMEDEACVIITTYFV